MIAKLEHVLGLQYLLKLQRVKQKLIKNQKLGYALTNLREEMDFSKEIEWPDSDTEQQESKLVEVSEKTLEEKGTGSDTRKIPTP